MSNLSTVYRAVALAASLSATAMAAPLTSATISIDTFLTGGSGASGNTALVATLELTQSGNDVNFNLINTLNNLAAGGNGFLSQLMFSYDQSPTITLANFGNFGGSQLIQSSAISLGNQVNAGDTFYIDLGFPTTNNPNANPNRFVNGENASWTITGVTIEDFLTPSANNSDGALALVHLQGLGTNGYSVKYIGDQDDDGSSNPGGGNVPEPGTLALVALGLLAAGWRSRTSN